MTEKEFEQLKVGDKVWIVTDWFNKSNEGMKAVELEVKGKEDDEQIIQFLGVCFKAEYCSLTKSEAWEKAIKRFEEALKSQEQEVEKDRKALDRYKAELAKAKEEEESGWVIINEHIHKAFPSDCYRGFQKYPTEQEAYSALADFYKGKYEEALVKSGKARFVIRCQDRICLATNIEKYDDKKCWCRDYDGFEYPVYKSDMFNTRQEAEAELERRKRND